MCDYWEGTPLAEAIRNDIKTNDLEAMFQHVSEAEAEAAIQEFHNADAI